MKILTLVASLGKGGVERTAQIFAEGYQALGVDSRVLAVVKGGPREEYLQSKGIPFWIGIHDRSMKEIREWNPEAIHIHSHGFDLENNPFLCDLLANRTVVEKNIFSLPVPWTHRTNYSYQLSCWCDWRFCTFAPQLASKAVIVPNAAIATSFIRAAAEEVMAFKQQYNIPGQALVIGRIGQHFETKWSPVLIHAFNRLAKKYDSLHLLLVSPSKRIVAQAGTSPFSKRITIIDYILGDTSLSTAYSAMDIFALAADQGESFGNVLAEAMLCEVPVVALSTPWGDNSQCEVTGHRQGGLIALSPTGFRKALDALIRDPQLRETLGRTGRKRIMEKYDYLKVAQQSLDIIQGKIRPEKRHDLDQKIIAIYKDAFDRPSPLTLFFLKKKKYLWMTRYTTQYEPVRHLLSKVYGMMRSRLKPRRD